jgi:predicted nucleic acid-binding protein
LYICAWAWMEYAHVIRKQSFRASLPLETQQQFRLDRWQQPLIRQTYMRGFLRYLEDLLDQFVWIAIPFTGQVQATALQQMMHYNLGSEDAVHLASATEAQVLDLASLDSGFRRVDGLSLWNDLIHA